MYLHCWYSLFVLSPLLDFLDESISFIRIVSAITSWQIEERKVEVVTDFIFLGSEATVNCDCSHEIRRHSLLGRKAMAKLGSVLKSRDITLLTKVRVVKAMVFPVVMCGFESWTVKRAEH